MSPSATSVNGMLDFRKMKAGSKNQHNNWISGKQTVQGSAWKNPTENTPAENHRMKGASKTI